MGRSYSRFALPFVGALFLLPQSPGRARDPNLDPAVQQILERLRPVSLDEAHLRLLAGKGGFKPYVLNPVIDCGKSTRKDWDAGALGTGCVIKVAGVYHMYYEAWGELSLAGKKEEYDSLQIGHAFSLDGVHWAKDPANPVIKKGPTGDWKSEGTWDPFVIYEDGAFKMWFGASKGASCEWGYAVSRDGSHFAEHGQISDLGEVEDCHVVHDTKAGEYRMYYWDREQADWDDVMDGPPAPSGLFVARSKTETDFDFAHAERISVGGQTWPSKYSEVLPYNGKWAMFFGEAMVRGKPSLGGLAFSDDGIHWQTAAFPIIDGHDAEVIQAAPDLWLMYYGPRGYFDWPEGDLNLAVYEGPLEHLAEGAKTASAR